MVYLDKISFPNKEREFDFFIQIKRTCYDSFYPFQILSKNGLERLDFEPITILYGGNGSGKSTALNVIAEKLALQRSTLYNKSNFYPDYLAMCSVETLEALPPCSCIITSDDVFDHMIDLRYLNEGIDHKREDLFIDYFETKQKPFQLKSLEDLDQLKRVNNARSKTQSKFVRSELMNNVREYSNGESAFKYFTEKIGEKGLYVLDEPENSLSPKRQIELVAFIESSARFFGCQFIIATHSPFMLALKGAKIYDLDENPVDIKRWTQLEHVRDYYNFFKTHIEAFEENK